MCVMGHPGLVHKDVSGTLDEEQDIVPSVISFTIDVITKEMKSISLYTTNPTPHTP